MSQTRFICCQVLYQVCYKHQHIKAALASAIPQGISAQERAWIQNCCYQTLRNYQQMRARWQQFVNKPIKDQMIDLLLTMSVTQKFISGAPDHATVNEAVNTCKKLKKHWAKGLVNSVLKKTLNDTAFQPIDESSQHNHPQWWIDRLK